MGAPGTRESWLGRYGEHRLIRSNGSFALHAAIDAVSQEGRVVAVGNPGTDGRLVTDAFRRIVEVHARLDHPRIARVVDHGAHDGTPFVAFACEATFDLQTLLQMGRGIGAQIPHPRADGFICDLRLALESAHAVTDPTTGRATCIGALTHGNVLFAADGRHWLIGFGHNLVAHDEHGAPAFETTIYQAVEVAVGCPALPTSDLVALVLFSRSMLSFVALERGVVRTLAGNTLVEDVELARLIVWFEHSVVGALVERRASFREAVRASERIRKLLGVVPDPDGFRDDIARIVRRATASSAAAGTGRTRLAIDRDARWFQGGDGVRHDLGSRRALRLILLALADAQVRTPGRAVAMNELFDAAWPGDRAAQDSLANRVYVALNSLRRMGLRAVLQRHDGGYRFDPALDVRLQENSQDGEGTAARAAK